MLGLLKAIDAFAWGPPLLILLVGTGIYLTLRLGLLQILRLPKAFQLIFIKDKGHGDVSSFAALCTALAATVGTGNIIGVATAIKVGGPGALFWMWMAAFFGMATKYAEGLLAIKYRTKDDHGAVAGGPMHYILLGMGEKWRPLAIFFAIAGVLVALLGIGTFTQVNSITESVFNTVYSQGNHCFSPCSICRNGCIWRSSLNLQSFYYSCSFYGYCLYLGNSYCHFL